MATPTESFSYNGTTLTLPSQGYEARSWISVLHNCIRAIAAGAVTVAGSIQTMSKGLAIAAGSGIGVDISTTSSTAGVRVQVTGTGTGAVLTSSAGYGVVAAGNATKAPIHISTLAGAPSTAGAGDVYSNSTTHKLYFHDGTSWIPLN